MKQAILHILQRPMDEHTLARFHKIKKKLPMIISELHNKEVTGFYSQG